MATGDALMDSILNLARTTGYRYSVELADVLALQVREVSDFEKLMRMPFRGSAVVRGLDPLALYEAEIRWAGKSSELVMRSPRVTTIFQGAKVFASRLVPSILISSLVVELVDIISELWDLNHPETVDPDEFRRGGCAGHPFEGKGIFYLDHAQGIFDLLDSYREEVRREWELLSEGTMLGSKVDALANLRDLYETASYQMEGTFRNSVSPAIFNFHRPKIKRPGVHPR